jgi:hypothetical protein
MKNSKKEILESVPPDCIWKPDTVYHRILSGMTFEQAVSVPARSKVTPTPAKFYVYCYWINNIPFWIGKGSGKRVNQHLTACFHKRIKIYNCNFYKQLRSILQSGFKVEVTKILDGLLEEESLFWESFFIAALGRQDLNTGPLANQTPGGEYNMREDLEQKSKRAKEFFKDPKNIEAKIQYERNKPPMRGRKYKGVFASGNIRCPWRSRILVGEKNIGLGYFSSEIEAAKAYNDAVDLYWGGKGWKNPVS